MKQVQIHCSGDGADTLRIVSHGNGMAYAVQFGESGHCMRDLFFQGDAATDLREEFDALEFVRPNMATRAVWLEVLDPYL